MLQGVLAWGVAVPHFDAMHARDAVGFVRAFVEGVEDEDGAQIEGLGTGSDHSALLLAIDVAAFIWLDDCFDVRTARQAVDWAAVARSPDEAVDAPEVEGLRRLCPLFRREAGDDEAYRLWFDTAIEYLRGQETELVIRRAAARGERAWSYAEFLQAPEVNISVKHLMSTVSLLYRLDLPERLRDARFSRAMRSLGAIARLRNDVVSLARERQDPHPANAVLLLEKRMPSLTARVFVESEIDGFERMFQEDVAALGAEDPFARVMKIMLASIKQVYRLPASGRYVAS